MKPRRPPTAILMLFLALLATWLIVRFRPSSASTDNVPTARDTAGQSASQNPAAVAPDPSDPRDVPTAAMSPAATSALAIPDRSPAATTASTGVEPGAATPDTVNQKLGRSDSASINAIRVRRMVTDYHTLAGENPVGTNAEIMAAIMGKNPRHATLGPPEGFDLNAQGELLDDWGTPYFFHQLSRDVMEIHSAGPDKIMGTADDIVVR